MSAEEEIARLERRLAALETRTQPWDIISTYLALPYLRGFWPVSSADELSNLYDVSGQGRTLTNAVGYSYGLQNNVVPYAELNGTTQYFTRADEAGLDITGALTLGGWWWFDALTTSRGLIGKSLATGNQRSYLLHLNSTLTPADAAAFLVSVDGTATTLVQSTAAPSTGAWHFIIGRYTPSTELKLWLDGDTYTNTTSIPASVFNSTAALQVGAFNAGTLNIDGRVALPFLCNYAVPDALISSLYQQTRGAFGV